jgi:tetratricopeptide (TPR) repeat protein
MIEPVPSVAPVMLRPAVSSGDAGKFEPSDRHGGTPEQWARRGRLCLTALLGLLRRLPSIEDARKIVVNALTIAAVVLALVVVVKTAFKPATIIDAIGVPKELEERGYTSAVVAQRLIDEITQIGATAATLTDHATFSSLPFENKVPKIDLPVAGMSLAAFVSQFRELAGIIDTRISGEVIAERASNTGAGEKDGLKSPAMLSLRLRILDSGTIHAGEPAAKLDLLLRPAALQVVERFDPYIAASYYYVSDDFDNAQRMVQRLLDTGVEEERRLAINLGGAIALSQKRFDEALAVFTGLIESDGHSVGPRLNRAAVRIAMGRAEQTSDAARAHFEYALADALQAIALTGAYAPAKSQKQKLEIALAHTAAGEALFRMGDGAKLDEAIAHLKRAEDSYPKYGRAYFLHSQIHRARNDRDQAIAMLSHAADVDPNNPDIYDIYTTWGELLREMGRPQEARKVFDRAIAANPRNPNGYWSIGKIYLAQRDWDKAAEYFRKAIDANPSWAWFHYHLARALAGAGKLDQSIASLQKATVLDPQHALSYAQWGRTLAESARQKNGKIAAELKKEAATKLAKAAELAPRDVEVLKEVGKSYELLNQPVQALNAYLAALAADGDTDEELHADIAKVRRAAR